jgi:hypothetical protein
LWRGIELRVVEGDVRPAKRPHVAEALEAATAKRERLPHRVITQADTVGRLRLLIAFSSPPAPTPNLNLVPAEAARKSEVGSHPRQSRYLQIEV